MLRLLRLALPALALVLAACDGPTETPPLRSGEVDFAFSLGTGAPSTFVSAAGDEHAHAILFVDGYSIRGVHPHAGRDADAISIQLPETRAPGVVPLGIVCGTICQWVTVELSVPRPDDGVDNLVCTLNQGEVRVERVSEARVAGTFSGSGECQRLDSPQTVTTIQIHDGDFDVPIVILED